MARNILFVGCVLGLYLLTSCREIPAEPVEENRPVQLTRWSPTPTIEASSIPVTASATAKSNGNADVIFVRAVLDEPGTWTFHVTVAHPDKGWEDYADGWDVILPDGSVLKPDPDSPFTRLLLHPHENEQPFTRSQGGLVIPISVDWVTVRAHDLVDGYGGRTVTVALTVESGPNFEIIR